MIKEQISINLSFRNPKLMLLRDCRVSVFSPLPKSENSEVRKILQKRHNTLILDPASKAVAMLFK